MKKEGENGRNASDGQNQSPDSRPSHPKDRVIPPRGDYQTLHSFHKAEVIYDINYLIDQQLLRLEQDFLKEGGLRERMTRARLAYRNRNPAANERGGAPGLPQRGQNHPPPPSSDSHRPPPRKLGAQP